MVGFELDVPMLDAFVVEVVVGGMTKVEVEEGTLELEVVVGFVVDVVTELELVVGFMLDVSIIVIVVVLVGLVLDVEVSDMSLVDFLVEVDLLELAMEVVRWLEAKLERLEDVLDGSVDELEPFVLDVDLELVGVALDADELGLLETVLLEAETVLDVDVVRYDIVDEVLSSSSSSFRSGLY